LHGHEANVAARPRKLGADEAKRYKAVEHKTL
jgi:hypothetical protein